MLVGKKLVVVLSVLAGGAGTAFFFRKDASRADPSESSDESPFRSRIERRLSGDARAASSQTLRIAPATTVAIQESPGGATDQQPTFRQSFNPVGALLEPIEGVPPEESDADPADLAEDPLGAAFEANNGPLKHTIADGDTLSKLAATYLDSSDRYLEIFNLNRDVLTSPDLLPIGKELKIPPRRARPAAGGLREDERSSDPAALESPLRMVPVPGRSGTGD